MDSLALVFGIGSLIVGYISGPLLNRVRDGLKIFN